MARTSMNGFTVDQLEQLLNSRRSQLQKLHKQRAKLARKLEQFDQKIARLGGRAGGAMGGGRTRARNAQSLTATLEDILKGGKPMQVGDITDAVLKKGYRSTSPNFRSIVNQTLIKEKQFASAGRGIYQLKK